MLIFDKCLFPFDSFELSIIIINPPNGSLGLASGLWKFLVIKFRYIIIIVMKKGVRGGPRGNKYNWNKSNNKPILIGLADSPAAPQIQKLSEFDLAKHVQVLKSNQIDETIT